MDYKICNSLKELNKKINFIRNHGIKKKIVFTNGCFDLIHNGHVNLLNFAKNQGDFLIVGINSDESITKIKGANRPIITERMRAEILASFYSVDFVYIFNEETPLNLIKEIKPDVLVKGGDWKPENIIGADFVVSNGGDIRTITLYPKISTTEIIEKIIRRFK